MVAVRQNAAKERRRAGRAGRIKESSRSRTIRREGMAMLGRSQPMALGC
jgi:hypothetical protein